MAKLLPQARFNPNGGPDKPPASKPVVRDNINNLLPSQNARDLYNKRVESQQFAPGEEVPTNAENQNYNKGAAMGNRDMDAVRESNEGVDPQRGLKNTQKYFRNEYPSMRPEDLMKMSKEYQARKDTAAFDGNGDIINRFNARTVNGKVFDEGSDEQESMGVRYGKENAKPRKQIMIDADLKRLGTKR
jgi:hypothetical protein